MQPEGPSKPKPVQAKGPTEAKTAQADGPSTEAKSSQAEGPSTEAKVLVLFWTPAQASDEIALLPSFDPQTPKALALCRATKQIKEARPDVTGTKWVAVLVVRDGRLGQCLDSLGKVGGLRSVLFAPLPPPCRPRPVW